MTCRSRRTTWRTSGVEVGGAKWIKPAAKSQALESPGTLGRKSIGCVSVHVLMAHSVRVAYPLVQERADGAYSIIYNERVRGAQRIDTEQIVAELLPASVQVEPTGEVAALTSAAGGQILKEAL